MRRLFSFFTGALVGGLVGGGLILLFTPYRGDELRGQLSERLDALGNEINLARMNKRIELETQLASLRAPKPKQ
jgi:gas vesicle protein